MMTYGWRVWRVVVPMIFGSAFSCVASMDLSATAVAISKVVVHILLVKMTFKPKSAVK